MLGEIVLSWKYPTRLVMVNLVPIGAFFLSFLTGTISPSAETSVVIIGGKSNCCSALGVLTRSRKDLSASRLLSYALTVLSSASSSSDPEPVSEPSEPSDLSWPFRSALTASFSASHPVILADMLLGSDVAHPPFCGGLSPLANADSCDFSSTGDMARLGSLDESASPQLFCRIRDVPVLGRCSTSSTTDRGDLWRMWSLPSLRPGIWFSDCSERSTRRLFGDIQEVKLKSRAG